MEAAEAHQAEADDEVKMVMAMKNDKGESLRATEPTEPPTETIKEQDWTGVLFFPISHNTVALSIFHLNVFQLDPNAPSEGVHRAPIKQIGNSEPGEMDLKRALFLWDPWFLQLVGGLGVKQVILRDFTRKNQLPWYRTGYVGVFLGPGLEKMSFWKL